MLQTEEKVKREEKLYLYTVVLQQLSRDWSLKTNNHLLLRPWSSSPGAAKAHLPDKDGVSRLGQRLRTLLCCWKLPKRSPSFPKSQDKLLFGCSLGTKWGQSVLSSEYLWLASSRRKHVYLKPENAKCKSTENTKGKSASIEPNNTGFISWASCTELFCHYQTNYLSPYKPIKGWWISDQTVRSNNDMLNCLAWSDLIWSGAKSMMAARSDILSNLSALRILSRKATC